MTQKNKKYRIALLGATGALGKEFLMQALSAGHQVTALVRHPEKLKEFETAQLAMIKGDATSCGDIAHLVKGADFVVSCLGNVRGAPLYMEQAAKDIIWAAAEVKPSPHLLIISSIGCGDTSRIIRYMLMMIGGKAGFMDFDRADTAIRTQDHVPYTLVRPYALTQKLGTGRYKILSGKGTFAKPIARADVATFLIEALEHPEWAGPKGMQIGGV